MDRLGNEFLVAGHAPRLDGPVALGLALGLERELRDAGAREGLHELELDPDQVARVALHDRHPSLAHLAVADPRVARPLSGGLALVGPLPRASHLHPRPPLAPLL